MPDILNSGFYYLQNAITIIGYCSLMLTRSFGKILQGKINFSQVVIQIDRSGLGSLPIVALSAFFIGMAISVQFAREIVEKYGATNMVGGFVAIAMLRELAPVFVSIVMAGNIGASITAEIATMKVTEQIDAMQVFHIDELEQLVIPRLVSIMISGPILAILGAGLALLAGQLFTEIVVHIPSGVFWDSARYNTHWADILNMLSKSMAFSIAIVIIASFNGLMTVGGSEAVGVSTTRTVVWCLLAIFILNYIFTAFFFQSSSLPVS